MALVDWDEQQIEDFLFMQFNAQHSFYHDQFRQAQFDVIELDNTPIGRLYVDRRSQEIRIIDIALLPDCRGKGIGANLMQSLIDEASQNNKSVTIHVEHNNPAIHLYQRLGFKHVHDEGVYYFMEWLNQDKANQEKISQEKTAS